MDAHKGQTVFSVVMAAYWAGWAAFVYRVHSPFVLVILAYAVWKAEIEELYCKLREERATVVLECDGSVVRAREFAWRWLAVRQGRRWQREYRCLKVGRPADAVRVRVEVVINRTVQL